MSITICPHCKHELDKYEDSIYCEKCGGNITREPKNTKIVLIIDEEDLGAVWFALEHGLANAQFENNTDFEAAIINVVNNLSEAQKESNES